MDYELGDVSSCTELEHTLQSLAEDAEANEDAVFDPSGSYAVQDSSNSDESRSRARSWHGDMGSDETKSTAMTESLQSLLLDDGRGRGLQVEEKIDNVQPRDMSEAMSSDPEEILRNMFPTIRGQDITYILHKNPNSLERSIEELLNHAFFEDEGSDSDVVTNRRGIEAFDAAFKGSRSRGRKSKNQRKTPLRRTSSTPGYEEVATGSNKTAVNRWDQSKEDVDFIAQRTYLPPQTVASMYHKSGGSLVATVFALSELPLSESKNPYLEGASPTLLDEHTQELMADFPSIGRSRAHAVIRATHPSTASAHELARAMSRFIESSALPQPTYTPLMPPPPSTSGPAGPRSTRAPNPSPSPAHLLAAKGHAQAQAAASYRASRSGKPLMAQAAGYHSSVARFATASLLAHASVEADKRVTAQSRPGEVDLHGLNVKDAVRVAKDRTRDWWESGAMEWAREGKAREHSLRVVVGVGRHSEGGKGRLGPAVSKALLAEGWKVEVGQGVLTVVGRMRR